VSVLTLTLLFSPHSISPESSDGFASVGTILPKEEATLLPGGFFAFARDIGRNSRMNFGLKALVEWMVGRV
jgi:hypothetical protein